MSPAEDDEAGKASAVGCDCRDAGACCGSLERKDQGGVLSLCYAALHPKSVRHLRASVKLKGFISSPPRPRVGPGRSSVPLPSFRKCLPLSFLSRAPCC